VVVRTVWSGSPAEQAGLRRGDEITSINGEDVEDQNDVVDELRNFEPGERLRLTVYRNGQERTIRARLASQSELSNQSRNYQGRQSQDDGWRTEDDNSDRTTGRMRLRQALRPQNRQSEYDDQ
jgi:C-terminal processing protease CtpA/Prc